MLAGVVVSLLVLSGEAVPPVAALMAPTGPETARKVVGQERTSPTFY